MNWNLLTLLAATTLVCEVAHAREYGEIRGEVTDTDGLPVPGAELVLTGEDLAGERRATTGDDGLFRFETLGAGTYTLTLTWGGKTRATATVVVNADKSSFVPLKLDLTDDAEVVEVIYIQPVMDTTSSAVSTTMTQDYLQKLPTGRSYQDVVNTIPGVSGRVDTSSGGAGDGNPSVRGEGQYGNGFTIDGVSVRDPATKTFGQNVAFDAIQEIQVFTDGAPAEFGQFTGMSLNVITKDGGDEHHGSAAIFYDQSAYVGKERVRQLYDTDKGGEAPFLNGRGWTPNLAVTAGGPIVKEKLWYFVALDASYSINQGRQPCPDDAQDAKACADYWAEDAQKEERRTLSSKSGGGLFMGKLTWFPTQNLVLRYLGQVEYSKNSRENPGDPLIMPEADTTRQSLSQFHLLTATYIPDEKTELIVRAGANISSLDVVPISGDRDTPSITDSAGALRNNATDFDLNDRLRIGGGLTFRKSVQKFAGDHEFKVGAEYWWLKETRDLFHTGGTQIEWIDDTGQPTGELTDVGTQFSADPANGYPCTQGDGSDCGFRQHWTNVGPLGTKAHTFFAFIQDDWQPYKTLTFNLGVRMDMEDGRNDVNQRPISQRVEEWALPPDQRTQCPEGEPQGPCTLGPLFMFAPRLGMAWDITGDNKTKLSAFYGWFYDIQGADFWSWANTRSADSYVRYGRDAAGDWTWLQTQDAVGNPLIYADDARPAKLEKVVVGFEREIIDLFVFGVRGIFNRTRGIPEDVNVDLDNWYVMNAPIKSRYYRALELWLEKRYDGVWQALASYTLSEAWGTSPGQFETASGADSGSNGNNVGVFLDDTGERDVRQGFVESGNGWLVDGFRGLGRYSVTDPAFQDDAGYMGYLPYHSFHSVKLNASYTMPWGTNIGAIYEFDSGHAWQKRTFVPFYGYDGHGQGRGTRFMPAAHYLDVRLAHQVDLRNEQSLEVTFDIFNLPGFAKPITYFENDTIGFGSTYARQAPRSMRLGVKYRW